ncbi:hypothetical protein CPB85DRAFT_1309253 [Mucidula mucida]|nr:hypothetical protein CPB85DRAFT_1309253 [Mucidula mucida]
MPPTLSQIATPLLVGFLGNCVLFGIMVDQIYWYYMSFPKDSPTLKAFVAVLTLLQTAQTGMMWYDALAGYALDFGSPAALDDVHVA